MKWAGAEVLATASMSKWEFLKSFGVRDIMNSRTLDFADDVMTLTDGQGVDVVLNSLAGDFIPKSLSVLGEEGRFIEIGKTGIWDASQVAELRPDVTYFPFDLGDVAYREPLFFKSMFRKVMDGFREGSLTPLPQKRYQIEGSISAFRYMAQAKHIGKIVVSQQDRTDNLVRKNAGILLSNCCYLVTGGLGALGLRIASWLVTRNARHIVLLGRRDPSDHAREVIRKLEKDGAQVHVAQADVSKREQVVGILEDISDCMPPLRGIIHAAGVLDDGALMQQTWERFVKVMTPKVAGAWNLHLLTKEIPLDFFVLFSSVSSLWGTPGQGNYSAANAFLDGLAHLRSAKRLPCVSINWGSWAEIGMAAALDDNIQQRRKSRGLGTIDLESGLEILGRLMSGESVETAVINVNWEEYLQQFSGGIVPPFLSEMLKEERKHAREDRVQRSEESGLLLKVKEAPQGEREQIVAKYVRKEMAQLLGIDPGETLDPQKPLRELGLDSLSAIELRNAFESSIGHALPATLLYDYPTLESVSSHLAEKLIPEEANTGAQSESLRNGNHDNKITRESDNVSSNKPEPSPNEKQPEPLRSRDLQSMVPIHTKGSRLPLFIVYISPLSIHLRLGQEQPIYYFRALWNEGKLSPEIHIEDIAADNIKEMKTVQPEGPYLLGGYSIGGLIAFEMAQQLIRIGDSVSLLFLLEPISPGRLSSEKSGGIFSFFTNNWHRDSLNRLLFWKLVEVWFGLFRSLRNSKIRLPATLKVDYIKTLHRLSRNKRFSHSYMGRTIMYKVNQAVFESGLSVPDEFRRGYVNTLYRVARRKYFPDTYPGRIIIYKVKERSTVDIGKWEFLAKGGADIKEMDLGGHLELIASRTEAAWIGGLKRYLKKAQDRCSLKTG